MVSSSGKWCLKTTISVLGGWLSVLGFSLLVGWAFSVDLLGGNVYEGGVVMNYTGIFLAHLVNYSVFTFVLSCVWLVVTLWTIAVQAPRPWDYPGKNTGVGCCSLLPGIFPTQGSNLCLLHRQVDSSPLSHLGSPVFTFSLLYLFSSIL